MPIIVRNWTRPDLDDVRHIVWETWLASYADFIPEEDLRAYFDEHYSTPALTSLLMSPDVHGFLAMYEGTAVGFARTTNDREQGRFYLTSIYVLPAFQGHGVGGSLLREAERIALSVGRDKIWLGVMTQNTGAVEWYRKIGFTFPEHAPFTMGQTSVDHLIGWRRVPSAGT